MAGYSGTPLSKKLGIGPGMTLVTIDAPRGYRSWIGKLPAGARIVSNVARPLDTVHLFSTERAALKRILKTLRGTLEPAGFVWVSWPKKSSGVATDVTEDAIRAIALPLGFVDVKVCAVTEIWSGLKLVIRKSERKR